jgi:hypothetical protein
MWWFLAPVGLVLIVVVAACSGNGYQGPLIADRRVHDLSPHGGEEVPNPVTISWEADVEAGEASGLWFVLHLDTSMVPPGDSIITHAGATCADVPACIDAGQVFDHGIFLTDQTSVEVGDLFPGDHRYTVLLVNRDGVRETASAWNGAFSVARS